MIKFYKLFILLLAIPFMSFSQIRHSKGLNMLGGMYGIAKKTFLVGGSFQHYFSDIYGLKVSAGYQKTHFDITKNNSMFLNSEFYNTFLTNNKNYYLNVKAGLLLGFEKLSNPIFQNNKNQVYFGESLGISLEWFLFPSFKLELEGDQVIYQRSLISKYRTILKLSIAKTF